MMEEKIGQIIKDVVKQKGISIVALSKAINVSRNNVYDIYERNSIDTELLSKIGQFLNYDFFQHLIDPTTLQNMINSEKIKTSKVLIEVDISEDEVMKIGFKEKVLRILNK